MILARPPRHPALVPFVEVLWAYQGQHAHRYERKLPSGRVQLLVNLDDDALGDFTLDGRAGHVTGGAAFEGARSRPTVIETAHQRAICGASFTPAGATAFVAMPASEIRDRMVDAAEVWGPEGRVLRERLLEAHDATGQLDVLESVLLERHRELRAPRDRALEAACAALAAGTNVERARERLGWSAHKLIDRFRAGVGVPPKLFARLARFQRLLRVVHGQAGWADRATAAGFADQAHMIREFRVFSGTTPTAYRARASGDPNHVPLADEQFSSIRRSGAPADCRA